MNTHKRDKIISSIVIIFFLCVVSYWAHIFYTTYDTETKIIERSGLRRHNTPRITIEILDDNPTKFVVREGDFRCHVWNRGISIKQNNTWIKFDKDYSITKSFVY